MNENRDSFDSVIETTQESIAIDHLTLSAGKNNNINYVRFDRPVGRAVTRSSLEREV